LSPSSSLVICGDASLSVRRVTSRPHRLAVRTPASHVGNTGSIPVGVASICPRDREDLGRTWTVAWIKSAAGSGHRRRAERGRASCTGKRSGSRAFRGAKPTGSGAESRRRVDCNTRTRLSLERSAHGASHPALDLVDEHVGTSRRGAIAPRSDARKGLTCRGRPGEGVRFDRRDAARPRHPGGDALLDGHPADGRSHVARRVRWLATRAKARTRS
jgi:hypothetical protein